MKRQLIKLDAVTFTEPGLPVLDITDEDIEIVSMPGIVAWLDPSSKYIRTTGDNGFNDRVNGYICQEFQQTVPTVDNYINGHPAILMKDIMVGFTINSPSLHPTGSYTKVVVLQPENIVNMEFMSAYANECRFKLNNAGRVEIQHGNTISQTADPISLSTPYLLIATYDAEANYGRVFINGVESQLNIPNIPLQSVTSDLSFGFTRTVGQFFNGYYGDAMIFDADYSKPEYSQYLTRLKEILAAKYALSVV